jgi:hypothetical protein
MDDAMLLIARILDPLTHQSASLNITTVREM